MSSDFPVVGVTTTAPVVNVNILFKLHFHYQLEKKFSIRFLIKHVFDGFFFQFITTERVFFP